MREREKIKVKIITESLWNRLPQYVRDEINGKPREMVEVVPCKECKWHGYLTCSNPNGLKGWVTDSDFCSYVERRETDVI